MLVERDRGVGDQHLGGLEQELRRELLGLGQVQERLGRHVLLRAEHARPHQAAAARDARYVVERGHAELERRRAVQQRALVHAEHDRAQRLQRLRRRREQEPRERCTVVLGDRLEQAAADQPRAIEEEREPTRREVLAVGEEPRELVADVAQRRREPQQLEARRLLEARVELVLRRGRGRGQPRGDQSLDGGREPLELRQQGLLVVYLRAAFGGATRPAFVGLVVYLRTAFGGATRPTFVGLVVYLRTAFGGATRPTFVGLVVYLRTAFGGAT